MDLEDVPLQSMTVVQLQKICRDNGLRVSGLKADIVHRIAHFRGNECQGQQKTIFVDASTSTQPLVIDLDSERETTPESFARQVDERGCTQLFSAASSGSVEDVRLLIAAKCCVMDVDHKKRTVLMYAAGYGDARVVRVLLDEGVEVNAVDHENATALMYAAEGGQAEVTRVLLTAHMYAAEKGHTEVAHILIV
eukprot:GEMP01068056.1.p1 GENE.GEMP01068056.1~~GEMP01068056.1.p1  ORF type:complete len:194 (+),score=52.17 GEMP01068056.1:73-654(+)